MSLVFHLACKPGLAFDRLREADYTALAVVLMLIRWTVTPLNTVWPMYTHHTPMVIAPPLGIDAQTWRLYEIFWYGPYGILITLAIVAVLYLACHRLYGMTGVRFGKVFELVCLAFFLPWLPSVPVDRLLIETGHADPAVLVPFHLAIVAWEALLVAIAFRKIYQADGEQQFVLGGLAAVVFLVLGGLVIR